MFLEGRKLLTKSKTSVGFTIFLFWKIITILCLHNVVIQMATLMPPTIIRRTIMRNANYTVRAKELHMFNTHFLKHILLQVLFGAGINIVMQSFW